MGAAEVFFIACKKKAGLPTQVMTCFSLWGVKELGIRRFRIRLGLCSRENSERRLHIPRALIIYIFGILFTDIVVSHIIEQEEMLHTLSQD